MTSYDDITWDDDTYGRAAIETRAAVAEAVRSTRLELTHGTGSGTAVIANYFHVHPTPELGAGVAHRRVLLATDDGRQVMIGFTGAEVDSNPDRLPGEMRDLAVTLLAGFEPQAGIVAAALRLGFSLPARATGRGVLVVSWPS